MLKFSMKHLNTIKTPQITLGMTKTSIQTTKKQKYKEKYIVQKSKKKHDSVQPAFSEESLQ